MEMIGTAESRLQKLKNSFYKDEIPFVDRRELNWSLVGKVFVGVVFCAIIVLLLVPASKPEVTNFNERNESGNSSPGISEVSPSVTTAAQLEQARVNLGSVHKDFGYLYSDSSRSTRGNGREQNSSMIVAREGLDSRTQIPPGSRIRVRLIEKAVVADQAMPVIGLVASDFVSESGLAVPRDSKLFGEASFDSDDRAQVSWRSIQTPDGRQRQFSAISVGSDGQVGVEGKVHSQAVKNTVGQTITRFIGAYAEGSMERGSFGGNPGGRDNGYKNAIAETAKDRADAWAEGLKKEKRWIELKADAEFFAVLKEPFTFRDPGGYTR